MAVDGKDWFSLGNVVPQKSMHPACFSRQGHAREGRSHSGEGEAVEVQEPAMMVNTKLAVEVVDAG